jgi:ribonuclease D
MEAVGSASAILQVLDTALNVYLAISNYVTAVKAAPKRSRELRDETRLLTEALKVLKAKTTSSPHSLSESSAVKAMMDAIDELTTILKELESRMHVSKGDIYRRLTWPFSESETDKYLQKFQRCNVFFQTILHSLETFIPLRISWTS